MLNPDEIQRLQAIEQLFAGTKGKENSHAFFLFNLIQRECGYVAGPPPQPEPTPTYPPAVVTCVRGEPEYEPTRVAPPEGWTPGVEEPDPLEAF